MSAAAKASQAKAKAKAQAKAQAPKLIGGMEIKLDDISIEEDSGWREIDEDRCDELEAIILDGGWGATSLKGPSLIADDGGKVQYSTCDGKAKLFEDDFCMPGRPIPA